ncbi:hypothetical protein SLS64_007908 [Diaporthe eres]|uniref:Uncharacterized protein n=1 Tax=Diaporthe eres TaxID=83184 RepID=A0ABR1PFM6_DIAER
MFLTSLLQAQLSSRAAPPLPGYGVEEMQWSFKPPFGEPIFINGTVQDVERSLGDPDTMRPEEYNEVVRPKAPGRERSVAKDTIYLPSRPSLDPPSSAQGQATVSKSAALKARQYGGAMM